MRLSSTIGSRFSRDGVRGLGVVAMASALLGCPNPQTYGTPRTTPAGKIQHTVALEGFHVATTTTVPATPATPAQERSDSVTLPTMPTYQLRVGLGDRVDIGARVANLSSLGADVKWNFVKSESVDVAIDPGVQAIYFGSSSGGSSASIFILHGHLPLLVGFNFGESTTLVLSGGLAASYVSGTATSNDTRDSATSAGGIAGRGGLGIQFRVTKKFALHPEVTAMKFFNDAAPLWVVFGLGFNFGQLPSYAKGSENDEPEATKSADPLPAPGPAAPPVAVPPPAPAAPPPAGGT
jgi:hypothetical protein